MSTGCGPRAARRIPLICPTPHPASIETELAWSIIPLAQSPPMLPRGPQTLPLSAERDALADVR
jgi:hypothetical protein